MRQTTFGPLNASCLQNFALDDLERHLTRSPIVARCLIVGLPCIGMLASLLIGLPLFAALLAGSFLLATALVARKALVRFASGALRLLVAARLVLVLVVGAVLFCTTGSAWVGVVSSLLLWLTAHHLLGRQGLQDFGNRGENKELELAGDDSDAPADNRLFANAEGLAGSVSPAPRRSRGKP